MEPFDYADDRVGRKEIFYLLPSFIHGIIILSIARLVNQATGSFDGWMPVAAAGAVAVAAAWLTARLASGFPGQSFYEYAGRIVTKPVALGLSLLLSVHFLLIVAFEVAAVGEITQLYLLPRTPLEVTSLVFFLVVIYGAAGSRIGLFRLNLLFFPIYFMFLTVTHLLTLTEMDEDHLLPLFTADWSVLRSAMKETMLFFVGFEVLLLYVRYMRKPRQAPGAAAAGMAATIAIALFTYVVATSVMGVDATAHMAYPTIELVKVMELPGGFFERAESLFFIVWMMTIFNTAVLAYDAALLALEPVLSAAKKRKAIIVLSPLIFIVAMLPSRWFEMFSIIEVDTYLQVPFAYILPACLLLIAKWRGLRPDRRVSDGPI